MPFLPGLLKRNLRQVMKMLLRAAVATSPYKLIQIDLEKKEIFLPFDSVKLPTANKSLLASSKASSTQKLKFKESCSTMLKNIMLEMLERSPLKYILVRSLSSLNPKNMVNYKADSTKMFTRVMDKLYDNKHLSSKESDNAKLQYEEFISDVVSRYQEDFLNFDMANDRLDQFFGKFLNSLDKYKNLWKVVQIIFVVRNGKAQI